MSEAFELYEDGILDEMGEYTGGYEWGDRSRYRKGQHTKYYCKTKDSAINGVTNWLEIQGSRKYMSTKNTQEGIWTHRIIREYYQQKLSDGHLSPFKMVRRACELIQKDFNKFKEWYNTAHPKN